MTVIKLSSSGKQLQVITDEGIVYGTSVAFVKGLMEGRSKSGFILLTRMPFMVSKTRFARSPVYNPESGEKEVADESNTALKAAEDAISPKVTKANKEKKAFIRDVNVW